MSRVSTRSLFGYCRNRAWILSFNPSPGACNASCRSDSPGRLICAGSGILGCKPTPQARMQKADAGVLPCRPVESRAQQCTVPPSQCCLLVVRLRLTRVAGKPSALSRQHIEGSDLISHCISLPGLIGVVRHLRIWSTYSGCRRCCAANPRIAKK